MPNTMNTDMIQIKIEYRQPQKIQEQPGARYMSKKNEF